MIRLGIVGTGGMAEDHALSFKAIPGVELAACCDIIAGKAEAFARKFAVERSFDSLSKMLAGAKLDAVTVVTPDKAHYPCVMKALEKNLHVMCEKPLALNKKEALAMARAARSRGVINNINFSYRESCAAQLASRIIAKGTLGRLHHVEASYRQSWLVNCVWGNWRNEPTMTWRLSTSLGSRGALGDIGVHIYDLASFIAGDFAELHCLLKTFKKTPGSWRGHKFDANDTAVTLVRFKSGAVGSVYTSRWITGHVNDLTVRVYGDKGGIELNLDHGRRGSYEELRICRGPNAAKKSSWETVIASATPTNYRRFINGIKSGKNDQPDFATGAKVQGWLDASFRSDATGRWVKV